MCGACRGVAVALFSLCCLTTIYAGDAGAQTQVVRRTDPPATTPMLLAVSLNGANLAFAITVLVSETDRQLWISEGDWRKLRLRVPDGGVCIVDGQRYISWADLVMTLDERPNPGNAPKDTAMPGSGFELDMTTQAIALRIPPSAFESVATGLQRNAGALKPTTSQLAGYLGYDMFVESTRSQRGVGGVFDLELSSPYGQLSATQIAVWRDSRSPGETSSRERQARRLDTTFTLDLPERLTSLRVGDFVTAGGVGTIGAEPARMGGIQLASNFAIRPGFLSQPLQSLSGQSTLPSVVEVFVNGVSTGRQNVPAGPFTIDGIPGVNGYGDVRLLVRDVLGREQVIVSSFFGSTQLLSPGLDEYSISLGRLRYGYGIDNGDYRDWVGGGYWRRGLTPWLTASVSGETSRHASVAGIGVTFVLPYVSTINLAWNASTARSVGAGTVSSEDARRSGHTLLAGFDRRMKSYSLGAQWRYASQDYRTATSAAAERDTPSQMRTRRDLTAYASVSAGAYGALSLNYLAYTRELGAAFQSGNAVELLRMSTVAAGYSFPLRRFGQISIGASDTSERRTNRQRTRAYYLNYFHPLDTQHSVGLSSSRNESGSPPDGGNSPSGKSVLSAHTLIAQRMLPVGEGFGYRVELSDPWAFRAEGRYAARTATYGIDISGSRHAQGVRAGIAGAIAAVDGSMYFSRKIADSFVVVDAGGFSHVRVYLDNNLVGRTDASGRLMIPSLRSYQAHALKIDPDDVPLAAEIDETRMEVVPARRSGNVLRFPLRLSRGAQFRLLDNTGQPIPAGAVVWLGQRQFPVAFDGEVYMLGLEATNELVVRHGGRSCRLTLRYAATADALPHLGNFPCVLR